jgi:hypothetical protein
MPLRLQLYYSRQGDWGKLNMRAFTQMLELAKCVISLLLYIHHGHACMQCKSLKKRVYKFQRAGKWFFILEYMDRHLYYVTMFQFE